MSTIGATLAARIEARADRRDPITHRSYVPSRAVLDALADRAIDGGYVGKRHAQCPTCFTARSATGGCLCD